MFYKNFVMAMVQFRINRLTQFLALFLIFILCKCDNEDPFLAVTTGGGSTNNSVEAPDSKSSQSLTILASGDWTTSVDQTWVKLSKLSGMGKADIVFEIDANPTTSARSANITIQSVDVSTPRKVVVNQKGCAPILNVSRMKVTFPPPESGDTLRIISNVPWTVVDNQSWLTVTPSSGRGNATLTLNAEKNAGLPSREAILTISAAGSNHTKNVSIVQEGGVSIVAGGNGNGAGLNQLSYPSTLWGDNNGNIFITDQVNNRVVKWSTNSSQGTVVAGGNGEGTSLDQLRSPYGIFVDQDGDLYIGDNVNHRIMKWTPGSASGILIAGGNGFGANPNQTSSPCGVYVDSNGDLFVAEAGIHRVAKWTAGANSGILIAEGAPISFTSGLTLDKEGNVYIVSGDNSNVTKWAPGAVEGVVVAGGNGRGPDLNQLNGPSGVFVADDGSLYITDQVNDRVVKWLPGATTGILVAGGNGKGSNQDQFNSPSGLWLDDKGYIYVSDQGNHRIVRWLQ